MRSVISVEIADQFAKKFHLDETSHSHSLLEALLLQRYAEAELTAGQVATERGIRAILNDERKGFRISKSRGLELIVLLAIREVSAMRGLIDFGTAAARLRATSFHFSEPLITDAIKRLEAAKL